MNRVIHLFRTSRPHKRHWSCTNPYEKTVTQNAVLIKREFNQGLQQGLSALKLQTSVRDLISQVSDQLKSGLCGWLAVWEPVVCQPPWRDEKEWPRGVGLAQNLIRSLYFYLGKKIFLISLAIVTKGMKCWHVALTTQSHPCTSANWSYC